jgi:Escherichia/Staphylococcus phage prohead protease
MQSDLFRPDQIERRSAEIESQITGRTLHGFAALYGVETNVGGAFIERLKEGCFRRSLQSGKDILALKDHDIGAVLGRTKSGTLKLGSDSKSLHFELLVPRTSDGEDVLELCRRGDVHGMSFAFTVPDKGGEEWRGKVRTLLDVDLHEVSVIISFAQYAQTEVHVRNAKGGRSRLALARAFLETVRA